MQHHIAGLQQGQQLGADGSHAAGKAGGFLGPVPEAEAVLQNLQARVVEAGVNEAYFLVGVGLAQASSKKALPSSAFLRTKVEVWKMGGLMAPSLQAGVWP